MTPEATDPQVALVTGANKGIGLETVRRLVGAGYRVYLGARDQTRGQAAAAQVGARFVQLDVGSDDSVTSAARDVARSEGRLDVLVNNAGTTGPSRAVEELDGPDAAGVMMTNVVGYVRVIHAFLPLLQHASAPRIVNVSSGLGSFGLFHDPQRIESQVPAPLYAASKAAINMLTIRYARLLPAVRVNAADPGMTATDLNGGEGHSVTEGTDAIVALATGQTGTTTGAFIDRDGPLRF